MNAETSSPRSTDDDDDDFAGTELSTDAIALLENDHLEVKQMFANYEALVAEGAEDEERSEAAREICDALTAHTTAEEEIFYPAAREAIRDDEMIDESIAEHAAARDLIEKIRAMEPSDARYDSTVRELQEAIEQHVHEEEGELFPRVQETSLDLERLGEQIAQRKDEVFAELAEDDS